jgi:hypothetical protein
MEPEGWAGEHGEAERSTTSQLNTLVATNSNSNTRASIALASIKEHDAKVLPALLLTPTNL